MNERDFILANLSPAEVAAYREIGGRLTRLQQATARDRAKAREEEARCRRVEQGQIVRELKAEQIEVGNFNAGTDL